MWSPRPAPETRLAIVAAVLVALAVGAAIGARYEPNSFLHGDGAFYALTNQGILDGTIDQSELQPRSWFEEDLGWNRDLDQAWSNVALGADGEYFPKHPLPMPLLATPLFWLFGYAGLLLFNALGLGALLWLSWRFACRWARPPVALAAVVAVSALPLMTRSAYAYSNDVFYAALVLAGLEGWVRGRFRVSGAAFGLAMWAKPTNIVFGLPLGLWLIWKRRWREAAWMAGSAAVPLTLMLIANALMFGSPFTTAYDRILVMEGGQATLDSVSTAFNQSLLDGVWHIVGEDDGLWEQANLLLLGLVGAALVVRRAPLAVGLLAAWTLAWLLFYGLYDYRYGRFFLPLAGLYVAPLAVLIDQLAEGLTAAPRRLVVVAGGTGAALLAVAALLALTRGGGDWRAAEHVTEAHVERVETRRARPIPCDYFNPNHERWECARVERAKWERWGRSIRGGCLLEGEVRDWLWLHVPERASKRITWDDVPPGDLRIDFGLAEASRHSGVKLRVLEGDVVLADLVTRGPGVAQEHRIEAGARRSRALTIEVPEQAHGWRQLCVDLVLAPVDAER